MMFISFVLVHIDHSRADWICPDTHKSYSWKDIVNARSSEPIQEHLHKRHWQTINTFAWAFLPVKTFQIHFLISQVEKSNNVTKE